MRLWQKLTRSLRAIFRGTYSRQVVDKLTPVPYPQELYGLEGKWVAVRDGKVVAAAETSRQLVARMREQHIVGARVQYVAPPEDGYKVGLG